MTDEEKIYGLISQAEEIQQHTIHLHDEAVKSIEEIKHVTREVRQNIQWAIKPILQSGLVQTVYIVVSALLVSLVVSVALVKGLGWYVSDMRADAAELKGKIKAEETTLAALKKKTWSLELMEYKDGKRGIILPKGVRFDQAASVQDGRDIVLIRLNDPEYRAEVEKRLF